jgi:pyridoxamine 5'-phosphate oxidase
MNFFWPEIERQVRIEGKIEKTSSQESEEYFNSRPFESRIGAIISPQSNPTSLGELEQKREEALQKYSKVSPERPEHWGGYCLVPDYLEFWQGRPGRLHDRLVYQKEGSAWKIKRIAP